MKNPPDIHNKEIPSLDGWRAIAIAIVFLSHAGLGSVIPGGLGVTIFFFLSGYLITTLLCAEFVRHSTVSIANFYARRAFRLLPPLFVTLSITYTLTYVGLLKGGYSVQGFLAQLLYFANYYALFWDTYNTTPAGTGIFWSLAVEEHFYFVFPIVFIVLFSRKSSERLVFSLLAICVLVLVWRFYLVIGANVLEDRTYYSTDTRIDSIVYGCLLALICNPMQANISSSQSKLMAFVIFFGAIILIILSVVYRNPVFRETARYSVQGLALAPIFFYSIRYCNYFLFKPLNWPWVRQIGIYSYSIYLIHFILLENLHTVSLPQWVSVIIAMVFSLIYAIAIDRFVDRKLRQLKSRF